MFFRILKYALKNILRNTFLSISSILVLTLLMFFINILLILHNVSFKLIESVNSKMTISLYLNEGYDKNSIEVINLINDVKNFSKQVKVQYKSKEEGLEEIREKDPELVKIIERQNPLPDTIVLSWIQLEEYDIINTIIEKRLYILSDEKEKNKDFFSNYSSQYKRISKVITILHTLQIGLYVVIWIFLISIAVIVYSIIWNFIYYYKDEIYITKLVGGDNSFIYGPFVFQWVIYTCISYVFASLIFFILIKNVNFIFPSAYSLDFLYSSFFTFFLQFIVFLILGWVSWFFSSRKYISLTK